MPKFDFNNTNVLNEEFGALYLNDETYNSVINTIGDTIMESIENNFQGLVAKKYFQNLNYEDFGDKYFYQFNCSFGDNYFINDLQIFVINDDNAAYIDGVAITDNSYTNLCIQQNGKLKLGSIILLINTRQVINTTLPPDQDIIAVIKHELKHLFNYQHKVISYSDLLNEIYYQKTKYKEIAKNDFNIFTIASQIISKQNYNNTDISLFLHCLYEQINDTEIQANTENIMHYAKISYKYLGKLTLNYMLGSSEVLWSINLLHDAIETLLNDPKYNSYLLSFNHTDFMNLLTQYKKNKKGIQKPDQYHYKTKQYLRTILENLNKIQKNIQKYIRHTQK